MALYPIDMVEMEDDGYTYLHPALKAGDTVYNASGTVFVITQEGLDCDCGSGVYCPFITQEPGHGKYF